MTTDVNDIGQDILGNELKRGDYVVYNTGEYSSLQIAKIVKRTPKRVALRLLQPNTFNFFSNLAYIEYHKYRLLKVTKEEMAMYKMRLAAGV